MILLIVILCRVLIHSANYLYSSCLTSRTNSEVEVVVVKAKEGRRSGQAVAIWVRVSLAHVTDLRSGGGLGRCPELCGHYPRSPPPTLPQGQYARIAVGRGPRCAGRAAGCQKKQENRPKTMDAMTLSRMTYTSWTRIALQLLPIYPTTSTF